MDPCHNCDLCNATITGVSSSMNWLFSCPRFCSFGTKQLFMVYKEQAIAERVSNIRAPFLFSSSKLERVTSILFLNQPTPREGCTVCVVCSPFVPRSCLVRAVFLRRSCVSHVSSVFHSGFIPSITWWSDMVYG